jgi:O-antigen ligase
MLALLYSLVIVGFPLVSAVPLILGTEGPPFSIAYRALVLVLAGCVVLRYFSRRAWLPANPPMLAILLLWWALLARLSWDGVFRSDGLDVDFVKYTLFFVGVCIIPAVAFLKIPSDELLRVARVQIEILGSLAALGIVYLFATDGVDGGIPTRLSTEILNPISVGHLGVSLFIASVCALQDNRAHDSILVRAGSNVARICVALGALAVVLASGSRGPILCAVVVGTIIGFVPVSRERPRSHIVVRAVTTTAIIGLAVAAALYLESETSFGVLSRVFSGFDGESSIRVELTEGALSQFAAHPIVGDAIVERDSLYYPHNIFVESLMAAGLIGFVLLTIVVGACVRAAWRLIRASHAVRWVGLLYMQYLLASMFSGSLFLDGQFWALSVAVLAISSATTIRPGSNRVEFGRGSVYSSPKHA